MTVDEELTMLDDSVRRLKIEYDIYFGGGSKKPPTDLEWRVQSLVKKYSDSGKMSFPQRFKYNSIVQKYAVYSDLWRQKLKIREEGYRRPQDAMLGIQGLRQEEKTAKDEPIRHEFEIANASEDRSIAQLFEALSAERKKAGLPPSGTLESFQKFVQQKTEQIVKQSGCNSVQYSVEVQDGQVRLKAKAKK